MSSGEEKAWTTLACLYPENVCNKSLATFDSSEGHYVLQSYKWVIRVSPEDRRIYCPEPDSEILLKRLGYFSRLSILSYLIGAKDIPLSGQHVKPSGITGGAAFFRGTHVLPLEKLAAHYSGNIEAFAEKGKKMGATGDRYGDASLRFFPLPRVPVSLLLWDGDDEFPARTDLLLDSTCQFHLPLDIIWSVSMMTILIMM